MSLFPLVSELSLLLPEWIYALGKPDKRTYFALPGPIQLWTNIGRKPGNQKDADKHLEYVLREACEARGWTWAVGRSGVRAYALVMTPVAHGPPHFAPTPAEALALAVLAALKAETP